MIVIPLSFQWKVFSLMSLCLNLRVTQLPPRIWIERCSETSPLQYPQNSVSAQLQPIVNSPRCFPRAPGQVTFSITLLSSAGFSLLRFLLTAQWAIFPRLDSGLWTWDKWTFKGYTGRLGGGYMCTPPLYKKLCWCNFLGRRSVSFISDFQKIYDPND